MRVLLIQLKRIGDLILTTPVITALRAGVPGLRLNLVVDSGCAGMLPMIRGVDQSYAVTRSFDVQTWHRLAGGKYDYCLDLTRNDRSAWLTLVSLANERITYEHTLRRSKWRPLLYTKFANSSVRAQHTVDHYLSFLEPLDVSPASTQPQLNIPADARESVERILQEHGVRGNFVVFHPGSARVEKFWEPDRWAELIRHHLQTKPSSIVLTGGNTALERAHLDLIKAQVSDPRAIDLSGNLSLPQFAALLSRAVLLAGIDSASAHFADALNIRQVVLFGPTNPFHWRPRHSPAVVIQAGHDKPATEFSSETRGAPMNRISTQQVIDAMETLLPVSPASA